MGWWSGCDDFFCFPFSFSFFRWLLLLSTLLLIKLLRPIFPQILILPHPIPIFPNHSRPKSADLLKLLLQFPPQVPSILFHHSFASRYSLPTTPLLLLLPRLRLHYCHSLSGRGEILVLVKIGVGFAGRYRFSWMWSSRLASKNVRSSKARTCAEHRSLSLSSCSSSSGKVVSSNPSSSFLS